MRNGDGKTTLIRTVLGLTRANVGTMSLLGIPVPVGRSRALARVGAIVDEPRFHPHLTGRDNLRLLAAARGGDAEQRIAPSLARVGLAERAGDKVATYSMGMRQRLGVAACLLADPDLLILDEPMNGLDPAGMHDMRAMIASLADEGRTVLLSSHLLDEVERTCDAVAIVDHGRVIRQGPIDELIRGAGALVVQVDCAEPARARQLIDEAGIAAGTALAHTGLTVTLRAGASIPAAVPRDRSAHVRSGRQPGPVLRSVQLLRRRPAADHRHRDGPAPPGGPGSAGRRGPRRGAARRPRRPRLPADADLGHDLGNRRLDRRLVRHRRLANDDPRRLNREVVPVMICQVSKVRQPEWACAFSTIRAHATVTARRVPGEPSAVPSSPASSAISSMPSQTSNKALTVCWTGECARS
jgi:ABC-2 type transport system ATP-binding protein